MMAWGRIYFSDLKAGTNLPSTHRPVTQWWGHAGEQVWLCTFISSLLNIPQQWAAVGCKSLGQISKGMRILVPQSSSKWCMVADRTLSHLPCGLMLMAAIKLLQREARPHPLSEPASLSTHHYFHTVKPWFSWKFHFGSVLCQMDPVSSATKTSGAGNCLERHFDPNPGCCPCYTGN